MDYLRNSSLGGTETAHLCINRGFPFYTIKLWQSQFLHSKLVGLRWNWNISKCFKNITQTRYMLYNKTWDMYMYFKIWFEIPWNVGCSHENKKKTFVQMNIHEIYCSQCNIQWTYNFLVFQNMLPCLFLRFATSSVKFNS